MKILELIKDNLRYGDTIIELIESDRGMRYKLWWRGDWIDIFLQSEESEEINIKDFMGRVEQNIDGTLLTYAWPIYGLPNGRMRMRGDFVTVLEAVEWLMAEVEEMLSEIMDKRLKEALET